jgi:hypothetical protein
MSGITDSVGEGWDDRKIAKMFNEGNNIVNGQEEVPMTRSKHFEHAYIILSTMTKNKLTTKKGKGNLFSIECYMPSFVPQNETVCKQHAVMSNMTSSRPSKRFGTFHAISVCCQFGTWSIYPIG